MSCKFGAVEFSDAVGTTSALTNFELSKPQQVFENSIVNRMTLDWAAKTSLLASGLICGVLGDFGSVFAVLPVTCRRFATFRTDLFSFLGLTSQASTCHRFAVKEEPSKTSSIGQELAITDIDYSSKLLLTWSILRITYETEVHTMDRSTGRRS